MTRSPFDGHRAGPWRRPLLALGALATVATIGGVYLATRAPAPAGGETETHQHVATARDTAAPVMLSPQDAARIGVTFASATLGPMAREVRTVAQVTYDETRVATITLKVDGWVEQLHVNIEGQPVRQGQPLLALYSPMLVSAQEELLVARRLATEVGAGTATAREDADELLEASRRRLAYWDVPQGTIAAIERDGRIRRAIEFASPVGGIVVERAILSGQRIMAGEPLFKIADLERVWLEGEVFEPDLALVRPGLLVTAEFPALPGATRIGRITYVYPTLNPETRTGRIRVELANPGLGLKPGMYATIRFETPARDVLSVPRSAVLATGERNFVFVADPDGMFTPRDVTLGSATDDRIEILRGLAPGERVVASGTFLLDAESNLGAAMGGMGDMPGMDMKSPAAGPGQASPAMPGMPAPAPQKGEDDAHQDH